MAAKVELPVAPGVYLRGTPAPGGGFLGKVELRRRPHGAGRKQPACRWDEDAFVADLFAAVGGLIAAIDSVLDREEKLEADEPADEAIKAEEPADEEDVGAVAAAKRTLRAGAGPYRYRFVPAASVARAERQAAELMLRLASLDCRLEKAPALRWFGEAREGEEHFRYPVALRGCCVYDPQPDGRSPDPEGVVFVRAGDGAEAVAEAVAHEVRHLTAYYLAGLGARRAEEAAEEYGRSARRWFAAGKRIYELEGRPPWELDRVAEPGDIALGLGKAYRRTERRCGRWREEWSDSLFL